MAGRFELLTKLLNAQGLRNMFVKQDDPKNLIEEPSQAVIQHLHEQEPLGSTTETQLEIRLREIREEAHRHPEDEALLIAQGIEAEYQKATGIERRAWSNLASYMYVNALNAPEDAYQTEAADILRDIANGSSHDASAVAQVISESFKQSQNRNSALDVALAVLPVKPVVQMMIDPQAQLRSMGETLQRVTNQLSEQQKDKLTQLYELPYTARMDVLSRLAVEDGVNVGNLAALALGIEAMITRSEAISAGVADAEGSIARLPAPPGNMPPTMGSSAVESPVTSNALQRAYKKLLELAPVPESPQPAYAGVGVPGVIMATEPMAMAASQSSVGASSTGGGAKSPEEIARKVLGDQQPIRLAKVLIQDTGNGDTIIGAGLGNGERRFIRVSPNNDSLLEISPQEAINACRKKSELDPLKSFLNSGQDASGVSYKTIYLQTIENKENEINTQASELGQQRKAEKITAAVSSYSTVPPTVTDLLARLYPDANRVPIARMPTTLTSISGDTWYLTNVPEQPPKAIRHPQNGSPTKASLLEFIEDHRDLVTARNMIEACGEGGGAMLDEQRNNAQDAVKQAKQDSEATERLTAVQPLFPAAESATLIAPLSQTRSGAALYWVQVPNAAPEIVAVAKNSQLIRISYLQAQQDITQQEKQSQLEILIGSNPMAAARLSEEQTLASAANAQFRTELDQYKTERQELLKYGPFRWRELDTEHKINPNDHPAVDEMLGLAKMEFAINPVERATRPSAEPIAAIRNQNLEFDAYIRANAHADVLHACQAKQIANHLPPDNRLKATTLYNLGAPSGYIVEAAKTGNLTMYLKGLDDYIRARIEYAVETTHLWKNNPSTPNPMVKTNQGYPMPTDPELRKSAIALYTEFADEIFMARYGEPGEQLTRIPLNSYAVCEKGSHALLILNGKDGVRVFEANNEFSEHLSGPWNFTTLTHEQGLAILNSKINMFKNANANEMADKLDTGRTILEDAIQQHSSEYLTKSGSDAGGLAP